ncbi:MAG: signal peptidase II [Acetivibrionales bacterium]|jgi:signal peptidase II|nr:signal peptidase II [Clostridiaceae bacterium]
MFWIIISVLLIVIDQLSKLYFLNNQLLYNGYVIIDKFFYLTYLENRGAAFGIFQDGRWFFIITTIIASGVMVWYFIKNNNFLLRVSLMLIVSGGIGNLIDRVFRGFVVDFLDFYPFGYDFPIFNFADICVTVGVFLFVIYIIFVYKELDDENTLSGVNNEKQD